MRTKDLGALLLLAALWSASFIFIRIAVPALGPIPLVAARATLAGLLLFGVAMALRQPLRLRAYARGLLLLGVLNTALPFTLIAWAELHITASFAALLNSTQALFTVLVGVVWLRHRPSLRQTSGLLVGVLGVAVLVGWSPDAMGRRGLLAVGAMLIATLCYGYAAVYTKERLAGASAMTLTIGQQMVASLLLLGPALWLPPVAAPSAGVIAALAGLVVLCTAVAYVMYFRLIATIGPTRTSTVTYLIPVFGMLWGALFLGEAITPAMLGGLALILVSVVLANDVRLSGFRLRVREAPVVVAEALPLSGDAVVAALPLSGGTVPQAAQFSNATVPKAAQFSDDTVPPGVDVALCHAAGCPGGAT